jgi:hypothetical protein
VKSLAQFFIIACLCRLALGALIPVQPVHSASLLVSKLNPSVHNQLAPRPAAVVTVTSGRVYQLAWNDPNVQLVLVGCTNLVNPSWYILRAFPDGWPTNISVTNNLSSPLLLMRVGLVTTNGLTLLLDQSEWQWAITN